MRMGMKDGHRRAHPPLTACAILRLEQLSRHDIRMSPHFGDITCCARCVLLRHRQVGFHASDELAMARSQSLLVAHDLGRDHSTYDEAEECKPVAEIVRRHV